MRRREAVLLFREICQCIPDAFISSISLSPNNTYKNEFELRINVALDARSLKDIRSVIDKHGLILKEDYGTLFIRGQRKYPSEMEIVT